MVAVIGGIAAVVALRLSLGTLLALMPSDVPRLNEIHANWEVVVAALAISLTAGVLIGLAPAYYATGADSNRALKEGGRTGSAPSARQNRSRSALVVSQIALSVVLLIAAGLLIRSFAIVLEQDPGLDPTNLVAGQVWVPVPNNPAANKYLDPGKLASMVSELHERLTHLPGVEYAALGTPADIPLLGGTNNARPFSLPDESTTQQNDYAAKFGAVGPLYFAALRIPVVKGRVFTQHDDLTAPTVAVVNEAFVRKFSHGRDIVGRRLSGTRNATQFEIVGVVGDVRENGLDAETAPRVYLSLLQRPNVALAVFMRSRNGPRTVRDALEQTVHEVGLDPSWITLEITETDAMSDLVQVTENAARIRMLGFNLAIDDFGTAYSSLTQLARIPFSELKIERAFVTGCRHDAGKRAIVAACAMLGRSLGLQVVAEGVETADDLDCVREAGCSHVQGYHFARPFPVRQAMAWLRSLDALQLPHG